MKKCPICNHNLYGEEGGKRWCKYCGYTNDPNWRENGKTRG